MHAPASRRIAPPPSSVRVVDEVADLSVIFEPDVNVARLTRALSPELAAEGAAAAREPGFARRLVVAPAAGASAEARAALLEQPRLADDLLFWAEVLAELTGCERVGARLARVTSAMCPRLHVDWVSLRLVCTYAGRGTEFVPDEHVDRRWLGHASRGLADDVSGLIRAPGEVRAAAVGDVVLLKGEAWPDNAGRGAVHRSPAASADAPRLVLTLDAL